MRLALVQSDLGAAAHVGVGGPVEHQQGAFDAADFPQGGRQLVLTGIRGELAQDLARPHGPGGHGGRDAQDVRPVPVDQARVHLAADQWPELLRDTERVRNTYSRFDGRSRMRGTTRSRGSSTRLRKMAEATTTHGFWELSSTLTVGQSRRGTGAAESVPHRLRPRALAGCRPKAERRVPDQRPSATRGRRRRMPVRVVRAAATVSSTSRAVWAAERNQPSNWEGGGGPWRSPAPHRAPEGAGEPARRGASPYRCRGDFATAGRAG